MTIPESGSELPIISGPKKNCRTWLVADGQAGQLRTKEFQVAVERARQELEHHGVRLKTFPHDWSLPDDH